MHGPPEMQSGRGMLFFAAVTLLLALWMSIGRGDWSGAGLWYALSVFLGCYGAMTGGAAERWHRPLLVVGLVAGVVAFIFALRLAGIWS